MDKFSKKIQSMFGGISARYDLMNRLLSGCLDVYWRKNFVSRALTVFSGLSGAAPPGPPVIADIASGTGDVALEFIRASRQAGIFSETGPFHICCSDFSFPMLSRAKEKIARAAWGHGSDFTASFVVCDARRSCFKDSAFDMAFVAFGLRNFSDIQGFLGCELGRILKKRRAVAAILEFNNIFRPSGLITKFFLVFQFYYDFVIDILARIFSSDASAYRYLVDSIRNFPADSAIVRHFFYGGFQAVRYKRIFPYIVSRYIAIINNS